MIVRQPLAAASTLALLAVLAACADSSGGGSGATTSYAVKAGDKTCEVQETSLDAGKVTFDVENTGDQVTEVYVYGRDGSEFTKIVGERENIGPGTSQKLTVDLPSGDYQVACKPGMTGDGIRTDITVSGKGGGSSSEAAYDRELEFGVDADGTVSAPGKRSAKTGEKIEFKLENDSDSEHYLVLTGPNGTELGKAEAEGGADAEFVAELAKPGAHVVRVYEDGKESAGTSVRLTVG